MSLPSEIGLAGAVFLASPDHNAGVIKVERQTFNPDRPLIETVRGVGYRFRVK